MGSFSDYLENASLDHILGTTTYVPKSTVYLALSTTNPDDAIGNLTEPGENYIRKAIAFSAASLRTIIQNGAVAFDQATGDWGVITHWAIMEDESGGNMLAHGALLASKNVTAGKTFSMPDTQIEISILTGAWSTYLSHMVLDFVFRNQTFASPTIYVALVETSAITDASTGSTIDEMDMTAYAREAHSAWAASSLGSSSNTGVIDFGVLTGTGETIEGSCLCDSSGIGTGNVLIYDNSLSQVVDPDDSVEFASGAWSITLT